MIRNIETESVLMKAHKDTLNCLIQINGSMTAKDIEYVLYRYQMESDKMKLKSDMLDEHGMDSLSINGIHHCYS